MPSYIIATSNGLFLFKCFKEKRVQNSALQNYFKTNLMAGNGNCAKMFYGKY